MLVTVSHDSKRALQFTIPQYVFDFITCLQRQEKFAKLLYCLQKDRIGRASMLYCFSYAQSILTTMTTSYTKQCPLIKECFGIDDSLFASEKFIMSAIRQTSASKSNQTHYCNNGCVVLLGSVPLFSPGYWQNSWTYGLHRQKKL